MLDLVWTIAVDTVRTLAFAALLLPIALAAASWSQERWDPAYAAAVGIAAVVSTLVLSGLILSVVPGVSVWGWIAILVPLDLVLTIRARRQSVGRERRRAKASILRPSDATSPDAGRRDAPRSAPRFRGGGRLPFVIAAAALGITVAAIAFSHASASRHNQDVNFTQLWMVLDPRAQRILDVGVRNLEGEQTEYRLELAGDGLHLDTPVRLADDRSFVRHLRLPLTRSPSHVSATLYRGDEPTSYRSAELWIPPTQ